MYRGSVHLKLRAMKLARQSGDQPRKKCRRRCSFSAVDGRSCHFEGGVVKKMPLTVHHLGCKAWFCLDTVND